MKDNELGIYIHIPFCKRKCFYCDFVSYPNKIDLEDEYINCVKKEIEMFDFSKYNVTTIYIGGGTPSILNAKNIEKIMSLLKSKLKNNKINFEKIEITIEINPGTVKKEKLEKYKNVGINRISIGLQTTENELLKEIGRIHTFEDFLNAYNLCKNIGFENINVDLMLGLPNQTIKDLKDSLKIVTKLDPKHISIYSLILEEGTPLCNLVNNGKLKLPNENLERKMYWYVKKYLENKGFYQYEISNFAKKGYESRHNLNCWNQKHYIGFGVAAHSYIENKRFSNTSNIEEYIKNINDNKLELNKNIEEIQTLEDQKKEFMMLGFRKIEGINIAKFKEKFVDNPLFLYRKELDKLTKQGLIKVDLNYIHLTKKGLDFANLVFEEFI